MIELSLLSRSKGMLPCVIPALLTAYKFRDAGNQAAVGMVLSGFQRPRVGGRLVMEQKPDLSTACTVGLFWGACVAILE